MRITERLFAAFACCKYKAQLLHDDETGAISEYAQFESDLDNRFREESLRTLAQYNAAHQTVYSPSSLDDAIRRGYGLIVKPSVTHGDFSVAFEALERVRGDQTPNRFAYTPLVLLHREKLTLRDKLLVGFHALVLSDIYRMEVPSGRIIHGRNITIAKVAMIDRSGPTGLYKRVKNLVAELRAQISGTKPPPILLTDRCNICEFQEHCRGKVNESGSLTLLRKMTPQELARHNSKGLFTIQQLSYTFRQRRPAKRQKQQPNPHNFALQALALRENKVHVHGTPSLRLAGTVIYLDIEGVPDRDLYYLIGVLVANGISEEYRSFWADDESQQVAIFAQLADLVSHHTECSVLHYGNYESRALTLMLRRTEGLLQHSLERVLAASANVLTIINPHIYFPTHSNGLKDISTYLGFQWTTPNASGLHSIMWRRQWEATHDISLKERLIQYNRDDCLALQRVAAFISSVTSEDARERASSQAPPAGVVYTADLRPPPLRPHRFGKAEFCLPEFNFINKCAYFNYQQEKVYIRTDVSRRRRKPVRKTLRPRRVRTNTHVDLRCDRCPVCASKRIRQAYGLSTRVVDLRFFRGGVKKWVTAYSSSLYLCRKCGEKFGPFEYPRTKALYGNGLMSWVLYWNIVCGQSMLRVAKSLSDMFRLDVPQGTLSRYKAAMAERYRPTTEAVLTELLRGPNLHVDETEVKLRKEKGHVWVFAGTSGVFYQYRDSRNGQFLGEMLEGFAGVLVTDFFTAYDSLNCPQQKCLIHRVLPVSMHSFERWGPAAYGGASLN